MQKQIPIQRISYLDSIRGLAALSVVIFHTNAWLDFTKDPPFYSPVPTHILNIIFNGHSAVSLFFVLSGFVLSLKYFLKPNRPISYLEFIIKRFFRIYPAFLVVFLLAFLVKKPEMNFFQLFSELSLLLGGHSVIPPAWSLVVEMQVSVIFLFLLIIAKRNINLLFLFTFLLCVLFGFKLYLLHFTLGIWLAFNFQKIQNINFSKSKRYLLFFIGLILCSFEQIHHIIIPHVNKATNTPLGFFLGAFGCAIWLILLLSAPKFQKKLMIKPLLFLGDISYGLYIGHWLIFVDIIEPNFQFLTSLTGSFYIAHLTFRLGVTVVGSIIFGYLLYAFVETPFIKLSKKVASKFKNKWLL
jgi:peptidoglycan/LPS O-acetylase OafA/YrhL